MAWYSSPEVFQKFRLQYEVGNRLLDENGASYENMRRLLGMKIVPGGVGPLVFHSRKSDHPVMKGFPSGIRLGDGRALDRNMSARFHRFVIDDPAVTVLGRYSDGRVAMGIRKTGKGAIVYAGAALTHPALYRNLADFAGAHRYSTTDDMVYADANYILIHTRTVGKKRIRLRSRAAVVLDVFAGKVIDRNCMDFTQELPEKQTFLYYIGSRADILVKWGVSL